MKKLKQNKKAKEHRLYVRKWRETHKGWAYQKCDGNYKWVKPKKK